MQESMQPVITVSKCLGFAKCRYNGQTILDAFVEKLKPHAKFRTVCPELRSVLVFPEIQYASFPSKVTYGFCNPPLV